MHGMESALVLLKHAIGLEPGSIGRASVEAVVARQMQTEGVSDGLTYAALLASSPAHLERLIDATVVTESWFFREPHALQRVVDRARAASGRMFRVLCLPCAGGEEAYSLAIALLEAGVENFELTACDISVRALAKARAGVYGSYSFRGRSPVELLDYLRPLGEGRYEVRPSVRARVRFLQRNVLEGVQALGWEYDAVLCRHLLIYLTPEARLAALTELTDCLAPGGELTVAACEGPTVSASLLQLSWGFSTFTRPRAPALVQPAPSPVVIKAAAPPVSLRLSSPLLERTREKKDTIQGLELARRCADEGKLDEALALCESTLLREPTAAGYLLMGAILGAKGQHDHAQAMLRRAVYLDPRDAEALRHLAVYAERDGRQDVARGLRLRADLAAARA